MRLQPLLALHLLPLFVFSATASTATAAGKIDLARVAPVPASEQIPIQDFFRPSYLQDPVLNPSGTQIAALVAANDDRTDLMVYDIKAKKADFSSTHGDSDIDVVRWLTDDRLFYIIGRYKMGGAVLAGARVGHLLSPYPILHNISASLIAVPPGDRLHPLISVWPHSVVTGHYTELMTVNADVETVRSAKPSGSSGWDFESADESNIQHIGKHYPTLETPDGFAREFLADKEGQPAFGVVSTNGRLSLHRLVGDHWEKCPIDLDEINVIGCGDNPGELVVLGARKDNQPRALEIIEGATGKVLEVLVQDKAYDCNAWLYRDPVSHRIVGAVYDRAGPNVVWFNEDYRNLQKLVNGLFPGQIVRIIGNDEVGKMVLIRSFSDRQPPVYSWVDLTTRQAGLVGNSSPWIDPKRMQPMSITKFKTRDGRQLDAYVTMPAGATKQNPPPLVVLPHNSQWWRDSWGYQSEVQFLASRGYAVLQPNYRGAASGSSWMFPTADEWAYRKMHEDVTDATKTMIASGLVDRDRVAIMGTEFAGFLALSGAAYEPGLYRCCVAVSAVPDWAKLIEDYRYFKHSNAGFTRLVAKLGDPKKDPEKWDAIAPLRHAGDIRSPLFIAWGEYDDSVNISGLKSLASAAERNHIAVETASFTNEADGVRHLKNKVELYSRIEAFLAKNLAPAAPAAP